MKTLNIEKLENELKAMFENLRVENLTFEEDAQMYLAEGVLIYIIDGEYKYSFEFDEMTNGIYSFIYIDGVTLLDYYDEYYDEYIT